jgi:hypothetical protein
MKKLLIIPQWLSRLLWWRSSPVPRAPSANQCQEIIATTLAGHNITGLTINHIKPYEIEPPSYIVTASFTLLAPKCPPKIFAYQNTLISWDSAKSAWVGPDPDIDGLLCDVEHHEHYAAGIPFPKTHNRNKEMLPCQNP